MTEDPGSLVERAATAGVDQIIVPGVDAATSRQASRLATDGARVLWTAGLHPHEASRWPAEAAELAALAVEAAAVGECGLDFYRSLSPHDEQLVAFRAQLDIAAQLSKPVIVHCRDAFAAVYEELERAALGARAVMHCWTGGPRWTRRFAELGVTFSFAGPVTFETGDTVRRGAAVAPPERTMVETDTPYLTPPPDRGSPNEPANVVRVGAALADVWGVPVEEVARLTTATARAVFTGLAP